MTGGHWTVVRAVVVLALQLFPAGCKRGDSNGDSPQDPIRIGVIMPLTGNAASLGKPTFNAIDLAISEFNADRGPNAPRVAIAVEDSRADAKAAVAAFNKLVTVDKVKIVIGPLTSTEAPA